MALLGFAPSTRKGPPNTTAQIAIQIAAGSVNGILVGPQFVNLTASATNYVFVDNSGNVTATTNPTGGVNLICTVVMGSVVTSGTEVTATGSLSPLVPGNSPPPPSTNLTFSPGITSIIDNRNWS
jgi:hypothetical protein